MPLLVLGLTTDTPINQGLGHTPQSPKLLLPGAGGSGNGPGALPPPQELAVCPELSFRFAPQTESLSHPWRQTLHQIQPKRCFYADWIFKLEAKPCHFSKLTFNLQLFFQAESTSICVNAISGASKLHRSQRKILFASFKHRIP